MKSKLNQREIDPLKPCFLLPYGSRQTRGFTPWFGARGTSACNSVLCAEESQDPRFSVGLLWVGQVEKLLLVSSLFNKEKFHENAKKLASLFFESPSCRQREKEAKYIFI